MADAVFTVDYADILKAEQASQKLEKAFSELVRASARGSSSGEELYATFNRLQKAGMSLSDVFKGMDRDQKMASDSAAKLEKEYLELSLSQKNARDSARAMEQAFKEQERATEAQSKEVEQLSMKYQPLYAASVQYERILSELDKAHKLNILSTRQHEEAVERLKLDYDSFQKGTATFGNTFVKGSQAASRGMSRMGVATQQAGYQVGDFLVQVQSGTNWMVAFGQQATQLVGILPMFNSFLGVSGNALVALSAGLGIAIPLITALGAMFMRTRSSSKEAGDELKTVSDIVKTLGEEAESSKDALEMLVNGLNSVAEVRATNKIKQIEKQISDLEKSVQDTVKDIQNDPRYKDNLGDEKAQQELINNLIKAATAGRIEELNQLRAQLKETKEAIHLEETINMFLEARVRLREEEQEARAKNAELSEQAREELRTLEQQTEVLQTKLQYGSDSLEVLRLTNQQEVENLKSKLEQQAAAEGLLTEQRNFIDAVVAALVEQNKVEESLWASEEAANGLEAALRRAASAMASLAGFGASIDKAIEVTTAKVNALRSGADAAVAGKIAGMRVDLETKRMEAMAAGADALQVTAEAAIDSAAIDELERLYNIESKLREQQKSSGSGRGGSKKKGRGGSDEEDTSISSLVQEFLTEAEKLQIWREDSLAELEDFNARELEILGGHANAKAMIEQEYLKKVAALRRSQKDTELSHYQSFFGSMATVFEAGGDKLLGISKAFALAEASISIWRGAAKALELTFPANLAAWGQVLATGAKAIQGISSASKGSSSVSGGSSIATPAASSESSPQRVLIQGLESGMRLSPEELQEIFDQIYEENGRRGTIFTVAT